MAYKIYKKCYHNKDGEIENVTFFIKKKKKFLGRTYFKNVEHVQGGYDGNYRMTTTFKTEEEAKEFILKVLCPGIPRQKWVETPIKEISCDI